MKILLSSGFNTYNRILKVYPAYQAYVGPFRTPKSGHNFEFLSRLNQPVALDNAAFIDFSEKKFLSMVDKARATETEIAWVAVPDCVGCARTTDLIFDVWQPRIDDLPLAYVAQDGSEDSVIPFSAVECVFIGGTTEWKLSKTAVDVIREAQHLKKIVHMGRVNSDKRLRYCYTLGIDSVDGTGYFRFNRNELLKALHFMDGLHRQETFL